jgi:hypothetical protein
MRLVFLAMRAALSSFVLLLTKGRAPAQSEYCKVVRVRGDHYLLLAFLIALNLSILALGFCGFTKLGYLLVTILALFALLFGVLHLIFSENVKSADWGEQRQETTRPVS